MFLPLEKAGKIHFGEVGRGESGSLVKSIGVKLRGGERRKERW